MKQYLSIFFIFLLLLQPISKVYFFVSFKINQDFIAKELCEKKAEPVPICKGKCYLKKQFQKVEAEEQTDQSLPSSLEEMVELLYVNSSQSLSFLSHRPLLERHNEFAFYTELFLPSSYLSQVFKPPQNQLV